MDYEDFLIGILCQVDSMEFSPDQRKELCRYIIQFNQDCPALLKKYSRDQIAKTLWFVYGLRSGFMSDIYQKQCKKNWDEFFSSVFELYQNTFDVYCQNATSAGSDKSDELNGACYMLWDMDGIDWPLHNKHPKISDYGFEVLEKALYLDNIACQESALRGLGHLAYKWLQRVSNIIGKYINAKRPVGPLLDYAHNAITGYIQ